jgi:hypothetical protein
MDTLIGTPLVILAAFVGIPVAVFFLEVVAAISITHDRRDRTMSPGCHQPRPRFILRHRRSWWCHHIDRRSLHRCQLARNSGRHRRNHTPRTRNRAKCEPQRSLNRDFSIDLRVLLANT